MGFMDELKKLTQPYDDDDDFFEGASESERSSAAAVSAAQQQFESAFGEESVSAAEPAEKKSAKSGEGGGLFGAFGARRAEKKPRTPLRERTVNFGGSDTQVILFNPKTFDEAGELVGHMLRSRSVVMTLEGLARGEDHPHLRQDLFRHAAERQRARRAGRGAGERRGLPVKNAYAARGASAPRASRPRKRKTYRLKGGQRYDYRTGHS